MASAVAVAVVVLDFAEVVAVDEDERTVFMASFVGFLLGLGFGQFEVFY